MLYGEFTDFNVFIKIDGPVKVKPGDYIFGDVYRVKSQSVNMLPNIYIKPLRIVPEERFEKWENRVIPDARVTKT